MEKKKKNDNIKCEICGYANHKEYISYSGICHGCGNILDQRAYFRLQMNKKLRIWRDDRNDVWLRGNNSIYHKKIKGIKDKSGVSRQDERQKEVCK